CCCRFLASWIWSAPRICFRTRISVKSPRALLAMDAFSVRTSIFEFRTSTSGLRPSDIKTCRLSPLAATQYRRTEDRRSKFEDRLMRNERWFNHDGYVENQRTLSGASGSPFDFGNLSLKLR